MARPAVVVEGLSKRYRIGSAVAYDRLTEILWSGIRRPVARLRRGRQPRSDDDWIWALKDVSFELQEGEILGIIGRNGAGKTTLLKILSRVTEPTEGRVTLLGRVGALLDVGAGFHGELTGRENVLLNGAILGMRRTEIERKFDEIVSFAEIERFIDTPVKRYSSGMYVRLAFAVAAHLEPEILIVDEVLAVGDAAFQQKCLGKMEDVVGEGRTVLFVSHAMPAIRRLCTSAHLIEAGEIVLSGQTPAVIDAYYRQQRGRHEESGASEVPDGGVGFVGWSSGSEGKRPYECFSGEETRLYFSFVTRRVIRKAHFGIAIWATDGTLVWACRSLDHGGELILQEGSYDVRFYLQMLPLRPGIYEVVVSANDLDEGHLDAWRVEPPLSVLASKESSLPPQWQGLLDIEGQFEVASIIPQE